MSRSCLDENSERCSAVTEFRLVPASDPFLAIRDRGAALFAFLDTLTSEERLELTFSFLGASRAGPSVMLALRGSASSDRCRGRALKLAARVFLPGFAALRGTPLGPAVRVPLRPHCLAVADVVADVSALPRPKFVARSVPSGLVVSETCPAEWDVTQALVALAALREEVSFTLAFSRFHFSARVLRELGCAKDLVQGKLASASGDLKRLLRLAQCLADLISGATSERAYRLEVSIGARRRPDSVLLGALSRLVFGVPPTRVAACEPDLDLSRVLLSGAGAQRLVPTARVLADLGFYTPSALVRPSRRGLVVGADPLGRRVAICRSDLSRHVYVVGGTGTGKSSLLASMIRQDVAEGCGVMLVDPHGDLFTAVRDALPPAVARSAIIADVADFAQPFTLNLLAIDGENVTVQRNFICNQLISVFKNVLYEGCPEAFGPMFEAYFRNALLLLMEAEGPAASLADFDRVFGEPTWRRELLRRCSDASVLRFWQNIAAKVTGEAALDNIAPYICSKLTQLSGNPVLRPIFSARQSSLDIPGAMADGRVVLCNLGKGWIGGPDAALLGGIITIRLFAAALARANVPAAQRRPFRVYLDEFQTYASAALGQMMAESRKFGVELVLANQSLAQVAGRGADIGHSILANVGSTLAFRVGPDDARTLADWFAPEISAHTLSRQSDRIFAARLLHKGRPCVPLQLRTLDVLDEAQ